MRLEVGTAAVMADSEGRWRPISEHGIDGQFLEADMAGDQKDPGQEMR